MKLLDELKESVAASTAQAKIDLKDARALGHLWHWLVGCCLVFALIAFDGQAPLFENPGGLIGWVLLAGLFPGSFFSRAILVIFVPGPYAWLARRLGLVDCAA